MQSRGPVQFCHPAWVVSLVLQNLLGASWSSSGHTKCVFLLRDTLFILASASAGHFGVFHAMSFPGAEMGCLLLSSRVLWRRLRPLPCSSVCGLHCTGPTNVRQSQWETVISCAGGQVLPGPLGLRIVSDTCGSLLQQGVTGRSYRRPLSPSSSGCRCHGCAGSRSRNGLFRVPCARCARAVTPSLLCEELCCHPGGRARLWLSRSSLRDFLGPVALRHSLLTTWSLVLGPGFLVRSPTLCRLPMGCYGWGCVYVSTF